MTLPSPWPTLALATTDAATALAITFLPNHTLTAGAIVTAGWAGVSAAVHAIAAAQVLPPRGARPVPEPNSAAISTWRLWHGVRGAIMLVLFAAALAQVFGGTTSLLLAVTLAIAVVASSVSATVSVLRLPRADRFRRDELLIAAMGVIFAIVVLCVPQESVHVVGTLGLYLAVSAVFQGIAGLSYLTLSKQEQN